MHGGAKGANAFPHRKRGDPRRLIRKLYAVNAHDALILLVAGGIGDHGFNPVVRPCRGAGNIHGPCSLIRQPDDPPIKQAIGRDDA